MELPNVDEAAPTGHEVSAQIVSDLLVEVVSDSGEGEVEPPSLSSRWDESRIRERMEEMVVPHQRNLGGDSSSYSCGSKRQTR